MAGTRQASGRHGPITSSDRNGVAVLSEAECMRRLGETGVGRVAVSVGALPAIFPINYAVRDRSIYFRTTAGTKLDAAARSAVIAFQIDQVDRLSHGGWSVLVVGPTEVVDAPEELVALDELPLTRWVSGGPEALVRLRAELVSGREIHHVHGAAPVNRALPIKTCPSCGSDALRVVSDGEMANLVCTGCFKCWHPELGHLAWVRPSSCPGCALVRECRAATTADETANERGGSCIDPSD